MQPQPTDLETFARQILSGDLRLCTWFSDYAEQRKAAQRAIDGDTDDLELMLDIDAAELWLRSDDYADEWVANWMPTASESTIPPMGCAA